MMYDVVIIGAGVVGCAIARELSKKQLKIAVIEKCADVCEGSSKANSGIVHAGYDAKEGTLKAKLNVRGSKMMPVLAKELDFAYKQNGSLVFCFDEADKEKLKELQERGITNGVDGIEILNREQVLAREPLAGDKVVAALYAPTGAIVCPFGMTIAFAENAAVNGVEFFLRTKVENVMQETDYICEENQRYYKIDTDKGSFESKIVINAAGVYADAIHNMVADKDNRMTITPRKGEYLLYDKKVGDRISHTIFQLPTALGKGVLVTPTVHGNLLMGPTAEDISNKEEVSTSAQGLATILEKAADSMKEVPEKQVITSFTGLRARGESGDFVIEELREAPGFIDVAGIESPGLSAAPAIGEYVADMVYGILKPENNEAFVARRKGIPNMAHATEEERKELIAANKAYANVICRCELVTEGEIMDAIHRPVGATTVDGIKRRVRAGMGRCQSGFCLPRTIEILARELGIEEHEVIKSQEGSYYLLAEEGGVINEN